MTGLQQRRRATARLATIVLAGALAAACTQAKRPAPNHLRIANLVQGTASVSLDICPVRTQSCQHQTIARGQLGPALSLAPARYDVTLHADDRTLSTFTIGLGAEENYSLALYGADLPGTTTPGIWPRIQHALGGSDARRVDDYRVTHRLVTLHTGAAKDPAQLRLANLVPGTTAVNATIHAGDQHLDVSAVRYGAIGDPVRIASMRVPQADATFSLRWPGRDAPLVKQSLHLSGGSSTVVYVAALDDGSARLLVDTRTPRPPTP